MRPAVPGRGASAIGQWPVASQQVSARQKLREAMSTSDLYASLRIASNGTTTTLFLPPPEKQTRGLATCGCMDGG
jgi:hypothetical protein